MRNILEEDHIQSLKSLNEKKVRLFKESNPAKWELEKDCPVPVIWL